MRRRGDRTDADFTRFVADRGNALARTAYLLTGDLHRAEDLLQTALAETYIRWGLLRGDDEAAQYVRRSLVESNTAWKRRRSSTELPAAELPDGVVGDHAPATAVREDLMAALRQLSPQQRNVIVLRYFDDLTERDVARLLSCSLGSVKQHASRGMQRLRELLPADEAAVRTTSPW
jgi:RNA polymerase sigma-70 factor (sigma-E family)